MNEGTVTRLVEALRALRLDGEVSASGRWVRLMGERCAVYVAEGSRESGYYTWCDDASARSVEVYPNATSAIEAGLRRAASAGNGHSDQASAIPPA